jgi:hypothetical protein
MDDRRRLIWSRIKAWHLILITAAWHVLVTLVIFTVGRLQLMPSTFATDGLGGFADDGFLYRQEIQTLGEVIRTRSLHDIINWPSQLHLKLYALVSLPFGNFNILTIEPLNLFFYVATLVLTHQLGSRLFGKRIGLMAAAIVGLWPSFLLHSTQLLRDPLLITSVLAVCFVIVDYLTSSKSIGKGLLIGLLASLTLVTIWIVRMAIWDVMRAMIFLGLLFLVIRQFREKRLLAGGLIIAVLLALTVMVTPRYQNLFSQQQRSIQLNYLPSIAELNANVSMLERLKNRRRRFTEDDLLAGAGSNIDRDVRFNTWTDVLRYLPRAVVIGFFAPFPNMWFASGTQVGRAGRLLSGLETLLTYFIICLAVVSVVRMRKSLAVWWIVLTTFVGVTGLGFIVLNVGALYRTRYVFWILLVILGAGGLQWLWQKICHRNVGDNDSLAAAAPD